MPPRRGSQADPVPAPGLLWCEGDNDLAFFIRMQGYLGIPRSVVCVETFDGKDRLEAQPLALSVRPGITDLRALAIVRDADDDATASFRSVRSDLASGGFVAPDRSGHFAHGSCRDGQVRAVGLFIAPDGASPGALERLYLQAVGESAVVDCARDFIRCISSHVQHVTVAQRDKAEFHAWLSTCERPGILPGQALDANYIDRDSPAFGPIKRFIADLAAEASAT